MLCYTFLVTPSLPFRVYVLFAWPINSVLLDRYFGTHWCSFRTNKANAIFLLTLLQAIKGIMQGIVSSVSTEKHPFDGIEYYGTMPMYYLYNHAASCFHYSAPTTYCEYL